jgi:hypothetical protein
MNEKIKNHISNFIKKQFPSSTNITEDDIIECLFETEPIHEENLGTSRWWMNTFRVVKIGDLLIGFNYAFTTGDDTPKDKGWEFDPETIYEVEKKETTEVVVEYIKKE